VTQTTLEIIMTSTSLRRTAASFIVAALASASVHGAVTSISQAPLVTSAASAVLPNLMFVLDDSGSMDWDYLPNWANVSDTTRFRNARFNGAAYDPSVTYTKPVIYAADGSLDTTTYPSQTGGSTSTGANSASTYPNWQRVKNDAYGVQSTSTSDLTNSAYFYTFIPGEYCADEKLRTCTAAAAPSASYPTPSYLRWCDSSAFTNSNAPAATAPKGCQAAWISSEFTNARYPGMNWKTSFTITGAASNPTITSLKINSLEILSGTTTGTNTNSTIADYIITKINECTIAATGNCQVSGYSATRSGSTVTISAPGDIGSLSSGYAPVMTFTGTLTTGASPLTLTAFSGGVPGRNIRTNIVSGTTSYPYPGTSSKASTRTDCTGLTCSYSEEMTNFANWWTYYRTRMQMMKTSTSIAFQPIGANYRIGYISINNNTGSDFLNPSEFVVSQKRSWYQKLFDAEPDNSTPLLPTLTKAGRLFAGKLNGTTLNGSTVVDPVQYSCQQNFTILSTDGYWNSGSGYQLDGTTTIDQQDGVETRPRIDSAVATSTVITPYSKVDTTDISQPVTVSTVYSRTVTTVSGALNCGGVAATVPFCLQDNAQNSSNNVRTWCMDTNNDGTEPKLIAAGVYASRGNSNSTNKPPGGTPCVVVGGNTWCIFNNNSTSGTTSCTQVRTNNSLYACKVNATPTGYTVTSQEQRATQTQTGAVVRTDDVTSSYTSQVVTTNGVAAPATTSSVNRAYTNITPPTLNISTDSGVPLTGAYANFGAATTSCSATPPAPSTTTGIAAAPTSANTGAATETITTAGTYAAGTPTTTTTSSGGTPNTLADVSQYYYNTDLRTAALSNCTGVAVPPAVIGTDVCANDVPATGEDAASWQHMTTFTLGLGVSGKMLFTPSYASASTNTNDFVAIKNGATANGVSGVCTWQADGTTCNWPVPVSDTPTTVDDLWHTAINGRGTYFSATNPASLSAGLTSALSGVSARIGSSAAATTSNPNVTSGDNFVFSSTFQTQSWDGELVRQQIDLNTGVVSSTIDWAAQAKLDARTEASRVIYTFDGSAANKLKSFTYPNLTATEKAYFQLPHIQDLSQFCAAGVTCLSETNQQAATGDVLVDFLRGKRTNEGGSTDTTKYFRQRSHLLGDIVTGEAIYVKKSLYKYSDRGYLTTPFGTSYTPFVTRNKTRRGMVYVPSNDGMLHAFHAASAPCSTPPNTSTTPATPGIPADCDPDISGGPTVAGGEEAWAYIPTHVIPNLYKLADKNYANRHNYFVDGTPVVADICTGNCDALPTVKLHGEVTQTVVVLASWGAGIANVHTASPHGFVVGDTVDIAGIAANGYNGTFTVLTVVSPTHFTFALASDPGTIPDPVWKTILVGGLNGGGRGYYALDVTDPLAPKALWEFTDPNMGYTYGNPEIGKLKDGTWVAMFTSGYNNIAPGDGIGRLFIVNAHTGALIRTISTGVGVAPIAITTASWSANVATVTTSSAHGFIVGSRASVTNMIPSGYNGTYVVTAVPSATQFRYALTADPFTPLDTLINTRTVSAAAWSAGTVTLTSSSAHGLTVGSSITISGFDDANTGYNGDYVVSAVPNTTQIQYALGTDPGPWTPLGGERISRKGSIATPWSAGTVTVTTPTAHGFSIGTSVVIAGASPSGYNGTVTITAVPSTTTFRYSVATDPGVGNAFAGGTPSNLSGARAWADNAPVDNTILRLYSGDMQGNVWRFDVNGDIGAAGYDAQRLVTLYADAAGTITQPITSRPEIGQVDGFPVVFVGTGRYLGTPDLSDTTQQSMYGIKDNLDATALGNPRTAATQFVEQVQTNALCPAGSPATICRPGEQVRTSTDYPVDFSVQNGWFLDFPDAGERDNTDSVLQLGTLVFNTNVPNVSACTAGGYSYTWFLDYRNGGLVSQAVSSRRLGSALATRPTVVRLPNNAVVALTRLSDSSTTTSDVAIGSGAGTTRRVSWRELITE
jgi:type IV pilus assembly protein PilY1